MSIGITIQRSNAEKGKCGPSGPGNHPVGLGGGGEASISSWAWVYALLLMVPLWIAQILWLADHFLGSSWDRLNSFSRQHLSIFSLDPPTKRFLR